MLCFCVSLTAVHFYRLEPSFLSPLLPTPHSPQGVVGEGEGISAFSTIFSCCCVVVAAALAFLLFCFVVLRGGCFLFLFFLVCVCVCVCVVCVCVCVCVCVVCVCVCVCVCVFCAFCFLCLFALSCIGRASVQAKQKSKMDIKLNINEEIILTSACPPPLKDSDSHALTADSKRHLSSASSRNEP